MSNKRDNLTPMPRAMIDKLSELIAEQVSKPELFQIWDELGVQDSTGGASRVKQAKENLFIEQGKSRSSGIVAKFIESILIPVRYVDRSGEYREIRHRVNEIIAFHGWSVDERGKLVIVERSESLTQAAVSANRLIAELRQRDTHHEVFKYCDQELLAKDLFHALHEAVKGLSDRLRRLSGLRTDGGALFDACLGGDEPLLRINLLASDTDVAVQKGFVNALKGAHGMWRNFTAHESRVNAAVAETELLDAMSLVSYLHKRLDGAVPNQVRECPQRPSTNQGL